MRSRILAITILILFLGLPVFAYFYFTTQKIAKLTISTASGMTFSVQLIGSFGVDGLPLADKMLTYEKNCTDVCTISPILPARYTIMLTASGKITLSDTIVINSGDEISRSYLLNDDIQFAPVGNISRDEALPISLIENATSQGWGEFIVIGTDIKSRVWAIKKGETFSQIGLLSTDRFAPIRTIASQILSANVDISRSVLILELPGNKSLLMSVDLTREKEIQTIQNIISIVPGDIWKIQTMTGTLELRGDRLVDDIRFTNSIDLSPEIRIGYIDKKDTKKLSIANLPLTESVLIRLDRTTGEGVVLRRGFDVLALFFYNNKPAYIDTSENIYLIEEGSTK